MASTYLTSGNLSSAGNQKKWTISFWVKRAKLGVTQGILDYSVNSTNYYNFTFKSTDGLTMFNNDGGTVSYELEPSMKFRDTSGWYHIVHQYDSEQATESNRAKLWVNGVQQSSWTNENYPSQGANTKIPNSGYPINIGRQYRANTNVQYFDGSLSHFHFCDGYAYSASDFGQTDANGVWTIKTSPSVTYGTNGFFILKDGNSVTDQSGNSNNFTVGGGTLTNTEDNPSNVFATWNPLYRTNATSFAYGNTESQSPSTGGFAGISTLGASSGKYYAEFKLQAASTSYEACIAVMVGSSISGNDLPSGYPEYTVGSYGIRQGDASSGNAFWTTEAGGRTSGAHHGGFSIGDTIGIALDIDNNRVYFSKNGQWNNSGSWNSATPSTYLTLISTYGDGQYLFVSGDSSGGNTAKWSANFGNGYQQTTAVASAGTNASGIGIFEYDVPTGYTALSTKGLNL